MKKLFLSLFLLTGSLYATTYTVTSTADTNTAGTLRNAMYNARAGDIIDCTNGAIAGQTVLLTASLPALFSSVTFTMTPGSPVTINGNNQFQAFSIASGSTNISYFNLENCRSAGAPGGSGYGGGGGGAGGGGGLYVHNGANVGISYIEFSSCQAVGGAGGAGNAALISGGGGGGGYGDTTNSGIGGVGASSGGGGGGGGSTGGGAGGAGGSGAAGTAGTAGTYFGGGGGGGGGTTGAAGGNATGIAVTSAMTIPYAGGASMNTNSGGGAGTSANGSPATTALGGSGGNGAGSDSGFAGGGGGGGTAGGAGIGTGGGGGGSTGAGGAGGVDGGGGGGGSSGFAGGQGGFGAGGGGGGAAGVTLYGGGSGGAGAGSGGGGGAGLGGAIFIQNNGQLTIGDSLTLIGNSTASGVGGVGGGSGTGVSLGADIFLRSGGSLFFNNSLAPLTISNSIYSDQGAGGGGSGGGLTMSGINTITLSAPNYYTGNTSFNAGAIQVVADNSLGAPTAGLLFSGGTLQVSASMTTTRLVTLAGSGTINVDTLGNVFTIDNSVNAITGAGALIMSGLGTLALIGTGTNTYTGGTNINGGIVETAADTYLGASDGRIMFNGGTLQMDTGYITSARSILMSGIGTINTQNQTVTLSGVISGGGSLISDAGTGSLILTGINSFSGTATILTGTLEVNSDSMKGTIIDDNAGAFLIFNQTADGTYAGSLTGSGGFTKEGIGTLTMTGDSSGYTGAVAVTEGGLKVNGVLGGSNLTSAVGTVLSGNGTYSIGTSICNGFLQPGDSTGQVNFLGDLTLTGMAELDIEVTPTQADFLYVSGTLTEGGTLLLQPFSGFYGFGVVYPIIQAGTFAGSFATIGVSNPAFDLTLETIGNIIYARLFATVPFADFPAANGNILSVANNLNALTAAGEINLNSPLAMAIDSLIGASNATINAALDQLHPALFSSFYDLQAEVGSQIIGFFHKRPVPTCGCSGRGRGWAEPYGNWLNQENKGIELGFNAYSKGIAAGIDWEIIDNLVAGFGGAWNHSELHWHNERGQADVDGFFGGAYLDFASDSLYVGASLLAGRDFYNTSRKIVYTNVNEDAHGDYSGLDILSQLSTAYFLGPEKCCLLPYFNLDFFYLSQNSFTEKNAPGLNLAVESNSGMTMRSELGLGLQVIDRNREETLCISPQVAMGWTSICPLFRHKYKSTFEGYTIPFRVVGWDHTWQLLTLRFGLTLSYTCYSFSGEYAFELAPQSSTPLFDQKANLRLDVSW